MPKYQVCVACEVTCYGEKEVEADNLEEAIESVKNALPLLTQSWGSASDYRIVEVQDEKGDTIAENIDID